MPYKVNNRVLPLDVAFTLNEIQYPANFLRLATEAEKEALGITWEDDAVRADDRFYWDGNLANPKALEDKLEVKEDGSPLMVQKYNPVTETMEDTDKQVVTKGLKSNFIQQVKQTAGSILAQTDWMVTRKADIGTDIPESVVAYRASVRAKADELEASISAVTSVESLASLDLSFPQE